MKYSIGMIFAFVLLSIPVAAQIYDGGDKQMLAPLDKAVADTNAYYANVSVAGADQEVTSQDERYRDMTVPGNGANERHFNMQVETNK